MKIITLFFTMLLVTDLAANEVRPGDLLLLPLNCRSCQAIMSETESSFAHIGIVIRDRDGQLRVAEALKGVSVVSISEFIRRAPKKSPTVIYRSKELDILYKLKPAKYLTLMKQLTKTYYKTFHGLKYDHEFLWNNVDEKGRQTHYCSELVYKLLNKFLRKNIKPTPMDFSKNIVFWRRFFRGKVPQGKLGVAPEDFVKSKYYFKVKKLISL